MLMLGQPGKQAPCACSDTPCGVQSGFVSPLPLPSQRQRREGCRRSRAVLLHCPLALSPAVDKCMTAQLSSRRHQPSAPNNSLLSDCSSKAFVNALAASNKWHADPGAGLPVALVIDCCLPVSLLTVSAGLPTAPRCWPAWRSHRQRRTCSLAG